MFCVCSVAMLNLSLSLSVSPSTSCFSAAVHNLFSVSICLYALSFSLFLSLAFLTSLSLPLAAAFLTPTPSFLSLSLYKRLYSAGRRQSQFVCLLLVDFHLNTLQPVQGTAAPATHKVKSVGFRLGVRFIESTIR